MGKCDANINTKSSKINFSNVCFDSSESCLSWRRRNLSCDERDCEIGAWEMILESDGGEESEICDLT